MGLTGFNLARRNEEEAANAASLSCPAPVTAPAAAEEDKPKRKRRPKQEPVEALEVLTPEELAEPEI
jgi:hypothetical protein